LSVAVYGWCIKSARIFGEYATDWGNALSPTACPIDAQYGILLDFCLQPIYTLNGDIYEYGSTNQCHSDGDR
jgi:hypothetical protein